MSRTVQWKEEIYRITNSNSWYDLLEVKRDATVEDITKAYHKLRLMLESVINPSSQTEYGLYRIKKAYETLTDEKSRERYDSVLNAEEIVSDRSDSLEDVQQEDSRLLKVRAPRKRPLSMEINKFIDVETKETDLELGPLAAETRQEYKESVALMDPSGVRVHVQRPQDFGSSNQLQINYVVHAPEESLCYQICHYLSPTVCVLFAMFIIVSYLYMIRTT